jgi:hypothetical protein
VAIDTWEEWRGGRRFSTNESRGQVLVRRFGVYMTLETDTGAEAIAGLVLLGVGIRRGDPHPNYPLARCIDAEAEDDPEHPLLWKVRATFEETPPSPGEDPQKPSADPDERAPVYSWSPRTFEEYHWKDLGSFDVVNNVWFEQPADIVNAAGDYLDNPPPTFRAGGTLLVKRWYRTLDMRDLTARFENRVNAEVITTPLGVFPIDSLKVSGMSASPKTIKAWPGYELTIPCEYKPLPPEHLRPAIGDRGWEQTGGFMPTPVLNVGWRGRNQLDGPVVLKKDAMGNPVAVPVPLDKDGVFMNPNDDAINLFFFQYERALLAPLIT